MPESVDYLIVGSGLTGGTLARLLSDVGREVLVLDRRKHLGGNVYDEVHSSGIRFHTYGPHLFRTNSKGIWEFVNRFAEFYEYIHQVSTLVDGRYETWPITTDTLLRIAGEQWEPGFLGSPSNFEEASLRMMPRIVYEKFVRGYTIKQWGVDPKTLAAQLAKRFDVREEGDRRFSRHRFQGLPRKGYANLIANLLSGISVRTGVDYLQCRSQFHVRKMLIYTGPIDEYYNSELGKLYYRGQHRESQYLPNINQIQPDSVINYPGLEDGNLVRQIEWKLMMPKSEQLTITGTLLTTERPVYPNSPDEYEYPFPDQRNADLYAAYRKRADAEDGLIVCGRLGEYRYYDMDHAIGRALVLAKRKLGLVVSYLDSAAEIEY
ncbi:MAG: NAD(P)-binding protein [Planctomycetaceae bacterium]|nr:NAD(P)-binding protein [Planctomycetaceae bacterium]